VLPPAPRAARARVLQPRAPAVVCRRNAVLALHPLRDPRPPALLAPARAAGRAHGPRDGRVPRRLADLPAPHAHLVGEAVRHPRRHLRHHQLALRGGGRHHRGGGDRGDALADRPYALSPLIDERTATSTSPRRSTVRSTPLSIEASSAS